LEWIALLPDLYQLLRPWLKGQRQEGLYEILGYDLILKLADRRGETALLGKPGGGIIAQARNDQPQPLAAFEQAQR
jgi:hypothetical protein